MSNQVTNHNNNIQFCILSALGIIFVVDGHLGHSFFDVNGLFQYYSFHMQLFIFISGYFYVRKEAEGILAYIRRKFTHLMVPYLIWNLIYGIFAQIMRKVGFSFGNAISASSLLLAPFLTGYQFVYNHAAWFVPALFLVQVLYRLLDEGIRKMCHQTVGEVSAAAEVMRCVICALAGLLGIYLSFHAGTAGIRLPIVRTLFLIPFFEMGILYKSRLEIRDNCSSSLYFGGLIAMALALIYSEKPVAYAVSNCQNFQGYLFPYVAAFTGIAFWLRISRILVPVLKNNRFILYLGRNTFPVMMHHMTVFFLINGIFALCHQYLGIFGSFDPGLYRTDFYYRYIPMNHVQIMVVYLVLGVTIPLGLHWLTDRVRERSWRVR